MPTSDCIGKKLSSPLVTVVVAGDTVVEVATGSAGGGEAAGLSSSPLEAGT
jgi:hypothetical protein